MPLSWPYGVTGPVVGQMFHVKHWLGWRWCSRRRRPRPPARLGDLASLGAASRSPPVPSGPSGALHTGDTCSLLCGSARRLVVRPGPATAHGHRSQALMPPTAPPPVIPNVQLASESPMICGYVERYTFSTNFVRHFPPISVSRPLVAQPGPGRWQALSYPLEYVADRCPWAPRPRPAAVACPRADVLVECDVGEWCLVPVRVCKKSAAPAGLRTCVELRRCRNSLSGGRPSPGAWRRRAR